MTDNAADATEATAVTAVTAVTEAAVLAELERILTEVIGDDLLLDGPLELATSFDADLQLESIEFVALAEQLLETYGERVDFVAWMADMELDQIIALTVGDVVGFVVGSLDGSVPGSPAPVAPTPEG